MLFVLYPVFKSISQLNLGSWYASLMLIISFVCATAPAIPTPHGIIISSHFDLRTASSKTLCLSFHVGCVVFIFPLVGRMGTNKKKGKYK